MKISKKMASRLESYVALLSIQKGKKITKTKILEAVLKIGFRNFDPKSVLK